MTSSRPCWTISDVNYAVPFEAGAVPDALFRIAHVPGLITRYRFRGYGSGRGEGQRVAEEQVLEDLLYAEAAMRVVAITGQVGTGKSHLVRWLHIELRRRLRQSQSLRHLHIVYVPKTKTTLRRVVERILEGQSGSKFDEFRQRLERAHDAFNNNTAPDRLIDELANCIRELGDEDPADSDVYRRQLIQELPTLIQDPVYRQALLEDGGVIRRTIDNALERSGGLDEGLPHFTEADLQLDIADVADMSPKARDAFARLVAGARYRTPALALMNEQIDRAVWALFEVRGGEIGELLLDVRAELYLQHRELVLLIEDFTVLQGVERELLEAVIAPVQEVGGRTLCPVRVAFAVTTGRFQMMETVISRVDADGGYRYSLDAEFDGQIGPRATIDDAVTLVGSYLNATRLGRSTVEAWATSHLDDDARPPNACNQCELVGDCHRGFGVSPLGHGLYPFNRIALKRILQGQEATTFEPREVLKYLRDTLRDEREAMVRGTFPTPTWARNHNPAMTPMARSVLDELQRAHESEEKAEQAEMLLMFWGGVTDHVVNLDPDIHSAFNVLPVKGAPPVGSAVQVPPEQADPPELPPTVEPVPRQSPLQVDQTSIARWRTALKSGTIRGRELPSSLARELRQSFADLALQRAPLGLRFLSHDRSTSNLLRDGIFIEGAAGGNPRKDASIAVRLDADDEGLFLALRKRHHRQTLTVEDLIAITEGVDAHLGHVTDWLAATSASEDRVAAAIHLLYLAAASTDNHLGGNAQPDDDAVVTALFVRPFVAVATDELPTRRGYEALLLDSHAVSAATDVVERALGVRQSVSLGGPSGLDAVTVLRYIDELRKNNLETQSSRARTGVAHALTQALSQLDDVLEEGSALLKGSLDSVNRLLGDDSDAQTVAEECRITIDALTNANAFASNPTVLRSTALAFARVDLGQLHATATAAVSNEDSDRDERLRRATGVLWRDVEIVDRFLTLAEQAMATSAERLEDPEAGFDTVGKLTAARAAGFELADALDQFARNGGATSG